jgi:LmbE family N-acetylglucosaminyl deacetylase
MPSWDADVDTFVDITDTIEVKIQALRCHRSQIGDEPVDEWIRERARQRGERAGMAFAESYRTFRFKEEPAAVETETRDEVAQRA